LAPIFEHKIKSASFRNRQIGSVFIFPLIGVFALWGLQIDFLLKIIGSVFIVILSYSHYNNTPFQYDRINLTKKKIINQKGRKRQVIFLNEIESINTNPKFLLNLKNENKVELNLSEWMIPFEKIKKLKEAIDENQAHT